MTVGSSADWAPFSVPEVVDLFADLPTCWWLSGGCAIDEFLGYASRAHADIDVSVAHKDWPAVHEALRPSLEMWIAALPVLAGSERAWLGAALRIAHPSSPWVARHELADPTHEL